MLALFFTDPGIGWLVPISCHPPLQVVAGVNSSAVGPGENRGRGKLRGPVLFGLGTDGENSKFLVFCGEQLHHGWRFIRVREAKGKGGDLSWPLGVGTMKTI